MNIVATTTETPPIQATNGFPPEYFQNREMACSLSIGAYSGRPEIPARPCSNACASCAS
jgi:hypothetical protein